MVSGIHQDLGLCPGLVCEAQCHAPVRNISVVEGRLKGLVFDEQGLIACQGLMALLEQSLESVFPPANTVLPRIVGTVGKPKGDVFASTLFCYFNAIEAMVECLRTDLRIRVAEGSQFV